MRNPPDCAEKFDINPLYETVRVPSKLLPGLEQIESVVACPSCRTKHKFTCTAFDCQCGLSLQHDIGVVHVWKKEPAL